MNFLASNFELQNVQQAEEWLTFTLYILSQPLGHTQLQLPAGHKLTPSLSPEYEVAEREGEHSSHC